MCHPLWTVVSTPCNAILGLIVKRPAYDHGIPGTQGYADSWLHSHISRFVLGIFAENDKMPAILPSQGAHNIDDVLLTLKSKQKVTGDIARELFGILESTYQKLGYIIDRAKILLSDRKFVLLSRYFIDGIELMLPLKTMIRAAVSLKNELPTLRSRMSSVYLFYKSVQIQGGNLFFIEYLKFSDAYLVIQDFAPPHSEAKVVAKKVLCRYEEAKGGGSPRHSDCGCGMVEREAVAR